MSARMSVSSGIDQVDLLLGGLFIGDNVIWYDDAGSLASIFCHKFLQASQAHAKPFIYVNFDHSPRTLLEKLGALANYPSLTILDCFTCGKGGASPFFLRFYKEEDPAEWPCRIVLHEEPHSMGKVMDVLYGIHESMKGDVRLAFESVTGMQELWGGEDQVLQFYAQSCPRLYELNTIAYWIMEKKAHSSRLRAQISQIAQVAIDLTIKSGTTSLTIVKAENRNVENQHKPHFYRIKNQMVVFDEEKRSPGRLDLGKRLRELRTRRGLSQTELSRLVGVTPSTISQVESNLIYPSLPALLKMAEVLSVDVNSFFSDKEGNEKRIVFSSSDAVEVRMPGTLEGAVRARLLTPVDFEPRVLPHLIEIAPGQTVSAHFMTHKGEELGYLLSGELEAKFENDACIVSAGDVVYLTSETPTQWKNTGTGAARLLWLKIR